MRRPSPVQDLFGQDVPIEGTPPEILEQLGKYGIRNLAYDGDPGCNPGYIFRGEADFEHPLRSSLERRVRKKLTASIPINSQMLQANELQVITCFVEGIGGRIATIFHPDGKVSREHPKKDIFWWLSLMQHYGLATRLLDFTRDIRLALYFAIEQHNHHREEHGAKKDLIVYCFPCKDLSPNIPFDPNNNKCPFRLAAGFSDMNLTLGCLIDLLWMKEHLPAYREYLKKKRPDQAWGWDMPYYQNPRLHSQKGMFFYPYDYPDAASPLTATGPSWIVQNLRLEPNDRFNLGSSAANWPPTRIVIDGERAAELQAPAE